MKPWPFSFFFLFLLHIYFYTFFFNLIKKDPNWIPILKQIILRLARERGLHISWFLSSIWNEEKWIPLVTMTVFIDIAEVWLVHEFITIVFSFFLVVEEIDAKEFLSIEYRHRCSFRCSHIALHLHLTAIGRILHIQKNVNKTTTITTTTTVTITWFLLLLLLLLFFHQRAIERSGSR